MTLIVAKYAKRPRRGQLWPNLMTPYGLTAGQRVNSPFTYANTYSTAHSYLHFDAALDTISYRPSSTDIIYDYKTSATYPERIFRN